MRYRTLKLGLAAATVVAAVLPLAVFAQPAFADYAPNAGDVVGVGSDTLQYMIDFMADGDAYAHTGYNQIGNKYKLVNFDATADANARLAYGVDGGQPSQTTCTPGTGSTAGTGNATAGAGVPCVLNPTIVLRAGLQPVQRPNGSGAGFKALVQDIVAGHNSPSSEVINFSRASATQSTTSAFPAGVVLDQLSLAQDTLPIVDDGATSDVPSTGLSASQLSLIYGANTGSCITWNDPRISGVWLEGATTTASSTSVTWTPPTGDADVPTTADDGWVVNQGTYPRTDTATVTSGSDVVSDASIQVADAGEPVTGTGIPASTFVGTVTAGTSFLLSSSATSQVNVDATAPGTSVTIGTSVLGSGTTTVSNVTVSSGTYTITLSQAATVSGTENIGLVNPSAATTQIIPLIPQVGSGTRSFFLGQLVPTLANPGTCAQVSEENDPTAIYSVAHSVSANPNDAIEPISQGRLDVYNGVSNTGGTITGPLTNNYLGSGGYFLDPSCAYDSGAAACGFGKVSTAPRTDHATVTSGSSTITDASILSTDANSAVTGTGIPSSSCVGAVTAGTSFVLDQWTAGACTSTPVDAVAGATRVTIGGWFTYAVAPVVSAVTTGTPVGLGAYTGTGQGGGLFNPTRTLYIYFRNSDINTAATGNSTPTPPWQPGSTENWLSTLFYNPCPIGDTTTCSGGTSGDEWGPGGAPYIQGAGVTLLEDAGVAPLATEVCTEIWNGSSDPNTSC